MQYNHLNFRHIHFIYITRKQKYVFICISLLDSIVCR